MSHLELVRQIGQEPSTAYFAWGCLGAFAALVASLLGFTNLLPDRFLEHKGWWLFLACSAYVSCGGIISYGVGSSVSYLDKPLVLMLVGAGWSAILKLRTAIFGLLERLYGKGAGNIGRGK
ncbi:hypothetical protein [Verrucomicrobium sp. BvORR034]|uniref:hypothetical protein n=1 Tax=Verrucomicrobium sp. BvORR034 TaxID=1396418 RepID=UPI002240EC66|nr:hypothetical protein [Verrucomicrobium sp. BvORR034]